MARRRRKNLASEDEYVVVATASKYLDDVCFFDKKDFKESIPNDVRVILERVKFSEHPLLNSEKNRVCECMETMVAEIWKSLSFGNKLKMMFVKGLK